MSTPNRPRDDDRWMGPPDDDAFPDDEYASDPEAWKTYFPRQAGLPVPPAPPCEFCGEHHGPAPCEDELAYHLDIATGMDSTDRRAWERLVILSAPSLN